MKQWIAFWSILAKDMKTYYLKPPNISWGIIFPLAWTGMFFIKSGTGPRNRLYRPAGRGGGLHTFRHHLHAGGDRDL